MPTSFKQHLVELLLTDSRFVDEQGELQGNVIKDCVNKLDEKLIEVLLSDEQTRDKFFLKVKDVYVFKTNDFKFYLEENSIDNSFTQYANRIGLTLNGKYLKDNTDIVLDFPYKDCILEGGQSTEEGMDAYFEYDADTEDYVEKQSKRKEIFYNTILAKDEIDRLLEPKAFANIKKYDKYGESIPASFTRDKEINRARNLPDDTITDNLLIKGNNLLALHTLESEFKNKVKLIYIDPPYNTGNDSFSYNDNFNHSTWLTFMKNRFEVAKKLLSDDGVIFIQIDERELAYLKILADDVFASENFVSQINWQRTTQRSVLGQGATPIITIVEYLLCYVKNINNKNLALNKIQKIIPSNDKMYNQYNLLMNTEGERKLFKTIEHNNQKIKIFKHSNFELKSIPISKRNHDFYKENFEFIVRKDSQQQESSLEQMIMSNIEKNDTLFSVERILRQGKRKGELSKSYYMNNNVIYHLKKYADIIENTIYRKVDMNNLWLDYEISSAGIAEEGDVSLKRGKKPEKLIQRVLEIGTSEDNDIVLDYHLGSGTTCAVAHKMNRQYIGIEQLDYDENDASVRLKNVIEGDKTGVSTALNWQGGGSFIYMELAKNNQNAKELINKCKSYKELIKLFDTLYSKYFLHYNVRINEFKNTISKEENFKKLSLERQKEIFCRMLDNNQLYVHTGEMEDKQYGISKDDIRLTKDFYQL